jgi:hypothetical protein
MFYQVRHLYNFPSYRKSQRNEWIATEILHPDGTHQLANVKAEHLPAIVWGLELPPAGVLSGSEPASRARGKLVYRTSKPKSGMIPATDFQIGRFWPKAMLQLVAKIGLDFAAAELGTEELLPMLRDIVLGRTQNATYLIGGGIKNLEPEEKDSAQVLNLREGTIGAHQYTLVTVHLFGQLGMPIYHVVVRQRPANEC